MITLRRILILACALCLIGDLVLLHNELKAQGKAFVERSRV